MKINNTNQLKIGSLLSYAQMGLSIVIGVLYTPVMIRLLGQSEYGLYNTVSSTISMLSILSLGFNSSYIYYYAIYKNGNKRESIDKLNGLFLIVFTIIGVIAFVCGLYLTTHLELVFGHGLELEEYEIAKKLMFLLTINLSLSFPMSVFSTIISANERFVFLKLVSMINTVFSPLITLPLLLMGYRSVAMVMVSVSVSCVSYIIYITYVFRVLKCKFVFHDFEKGLFRNLFVYTSFLAINIIVDQINTNVDKVLLARFRGTEEVAVYAVAYTLYSYYTIFSTSVSNVFTPRIHGIVNTTKGEDRRRKLTELFVKVGRIQFLILGLISTGIIFFGKKFIMEYWAGIEYKGSYYVTLLLVLPATVPLIQNLGIEIQRAQNKHKFRSIVYSLMAVMNLLMSIYLCQRYGAVGSAVGTAMSLLIANGVIINIYYHTNCNIDVWAFWKNIIKMSKGLIFPIMVGVVCVKLSSNTNNHLFFLGCIAVYIVVYICSMYRWGINEEERKMFLRPINKIVQKKE